MNRGREAQRHGAKYAQPLHQQAIRQRIQQKQSQLRDASRQARLSGMRLTDDEEPCDERHVCGAARCSSTQLVSATPTGTHYASACANEEEAVAHLGVADWSAIAQEFGCDISDPSVMEWLLALEEEIRAEALFAFFDDTNLSEEQWADYYQSLNAQDTRPR